MMTTQIDATLETDGLAAPEDFQDQGTDFDEPGYSTDDLSAYYYELECFLAQVEKAETHYETLGVDYLSTTGEIINAYLRGTILLDPTACGIDAELPEGLAPRVAVAAERIAEAFETLMNFDERLDYDGRLFGWESTPQNKRQSSPRRSMSRPKPISDKHKKLNRRARERFELSIPVEVTGYDENAKDWHEVVESIDLSRSGGRIRLSRRLLVGHILFLRMPMPVVLRNHEFLDQTYGTYAIVRWIRPPQDGFRLVGVEFIGELPPPGFRQRPWATFQISNWDGRDRRAESRETVSESIEIEYFDESEQLIRKDTGFIEDISTSGVRVCAQQPPLEADLIRVIRPKVSLSVFALVRNRFKGRDGYDRLCAQLIGGDGQGH